MAWMGWEMTNRPLKTTEGTKDNNCSVDCKDRQTWIGERNISYIACKTHKIWSGQKLVK